MAKLSKRPFFSHSLKAEGMETVRFVSMRGDQKSSWNRTWVKGTSKMGTSVWLCPVRGKASAESAHAESLLKKLLFFIGLCR